MKKIRREYTIISLEQLCKNQNINYHNMKKNFDILLPLYNNYIDIDD